MLNDVRVSEDVSISLPERVYQQILGKIQRYEYPPGTRLVNRKVAKDLGVSMTPVREALTRLYNERLVENYPSLGYFTKKFTLDDILKLFAARECICPFAARLAASVVTGQGIQALRENLAVYEEALSSKDRLRCREVDRDFHCLIARLTDNQYVEDMVTNFQLINFYLGWGAVVRERLGEEGYQRLLQEYPKKLQHTLNSHREIVQAIIDHDEERAGELMRLHIVEARENLLESIA